MGAGFHGGFGNTEGSKRQDKRESNSQSLPKNDAQIKHIFSGKEGHLKDTPSNRKLLTTWQIIKKNLLVPINMGIHGMQK